MEKKAIDKYLSERVYLEDIAGLSVSIRKKDELFTKAYGFSDFECKIPLLEESIFSCCSITKILTARAALDFDISLKVKDVLPWLDIDEKITIKMLLSHTSGLGDIDSYEWEKKNTKENALEKYLKELKLRMLKEPGERFIYSNIGYDILGACIKELSGLSYEKYVQKAIFDEIGMKSASLITPLREDREYLALPHVKDEKKNIRVSKIYPYTREHAPSSCLTCNIFDIGKLADYCMKTMKYEETEKICRIPDSGEYIGLGWFIKEGKGLTLYGHDGMDIGFKSSFWICPEENIHIVLLSNSQNAPLKKISRSIFNILT